MPAITVGDALVLPTLPIPDPTVSRPRPVAKVITAHRQAEGVRPVEDGRLGVVPADELAPRNFA